jgi:hypothetical protein
LTQAADNNSFKTYEYPNYGIQIQYPSNWTIYEGDEDSEDDVTDIISFFVPVRNDSETDGPISLLSYISMDKSTII